MTNWLREAVTDSTLKTVSAKRVAMLSAAFSLSLAVIILASAACLGTDVAASIYAVSIPLAGLGGYTYVNGKIAEGKQP